MKNDYLITENPLKALIVFAIPMIIGNLFQQAYTPAAPCKISGCGDFLEIREKGSVRKERNSWN